MRIKHILTYHILFISMLLCANLQGEEFSESREEYFDYKHFKEYPLKEFDTAKGEFDPSFNDHELSRLQELWKQAREQFVYHSEHYFECLETTKASNILADTRFLKHHIVFLLDCYPGVYQWYEGKSPRTDRSCCMHTQFMNHDPCVIREDGKYFGWPSDEAFNEIMKKEHNEITTAEEALQFVDFYLNLTSRIRLITKHNLAHYLTLINDAYKDKDIQDYEKIVKHIHAPHVEYTTNGLKVTFFTFAWWAVQIPEGINRWTLTIEKNGIIRDKEIEVILGDYYNY